MPHVKAATTVDAYVGGKIRGYRNRLKISQHELGELLGVSFQQVQKYEKGVNRLSVSRLQQVCDIFKCRVADMLPPQRGSRELSNLDRIIATKDGIKLVDSFVAIKNEKLRACVVALAQCCVGL